MHRLQSLILFKGQLLEELGLTWNLLISTPILEEVEHKIHANTLIKINDLQKTALSKWPLDINNLNICYIDFGVASFIIIHGIVCLRVHSNS